MHHTNAQLVPTKPQSQGNIRVGNLATIGGNQTSSSANLNRYMHHRWQASQYPLLRRSVHHCRIPLQLRCTLHQLRCPTNDCHNSTTTTPPPTHITVRSATPHRTTTIATSKQPPSNTTAATSTPRTTTANLTSAQTTLAEPHATPKRESPAHIIYIALLRLLVTTIGYLHRLRQRLPNYPARSTSTSTHRSHAYHALSTAPSHCNHPLRPASKARTYNYDGSKYNYDDSGPIYDALHNLRRQTCNPRAQPSRIGLNEMSQYRAYFVPGGVDPSGMSSPQISETSPPNLSIPDLITQKGKDGCITLTIKQYLAYVKKTANYDIHEADLRDVYSGCIGITRIKQRCNKQDIASQNFPEKYKNTTCYKTEKEAKDHNCGGKSRVIFSKLGRWCKGEPADGQPIPPEQHICANEDGTFNYVTRFERGREYYVDMNHCRIGLDGKCQTDPKMPEHPSVNNQQLIRICFKHPGPGGKYKKGMWCVTCQDCGTDIPGVGRLTDIKTKSK